MNTTAHAHDTITPATGSRRSGRMREHPAVPAGHRRAAARRRALGRPVRPARRRAAGRGRPAARADGPVAPRRVRGHRATRARPGMVLADPGRDDRDRAGVPGHPPRAGTARAPAGDPGRPAVDAIEPGLGPGPGLVAFRAAAARRAARGRPEGPHPRCGDPLALHRGQPVRGAGVGDRGRAHPETSRADYPDHDRAAGAHVVRAGDLPDRPESPPGRHPGRGLAAARRAGARGGPGPARIRVHPGARAGDPVGLAEVHHLPVAAPQDPQAHPGGCCSPQW